MEKNRRAGRAFVQKSPDRREANIERSYKFYQEHGAKRFKALHDVAYTKKGLIPFAEVQKITGLRAGIFKYLVRVGAIQRTMFCRTALYNVEQVACLIQAKIYSTVVKDDTSLLDMKRMSEFCRNNWPKWEDKNVKSYDRYRKASQRKGVSGNWFRGAYSRIENGVYTG
jgi:hypothetical protein